jgi:hypothetical protein
MTEPRKASSIEAIAEITKVIDLPDEGPGGVISIEIRKKHPAELLAATGTIPSYDVGKEVKKGPAEIARMMTDSRKPMIEVCRLCIVSPPFSFDETPEAGKAWWGHLSWINQLAIFREAMAFSGLNAQVSEDADAARSVARFPGGKDRTPTRRNGVRRRAGGRGKGTG